MPKSLPIPIRDLSEIITLAREDLISLKYSRILITGGTGFIGRWMLESFCHANKLLGLRATATILSRDLGAFRSLCPDFFNDSCLNFVEGDVRSFSGAGIDFTHVIHAATDVIEAKPALETYSVTAEGTKHILDLCKERDIEAILLLSSGAVYGKINSKHASPRENYNGRPDLDTSQSAYGLGKIVSEWLCSMYAEQYGFRNASARIFAQTAPLLPLNAHFAVGNFIRDALIGEEILIKSDGSPQRSYMYGVDLAAWLWRMLARGKGPYNVGSDHAISISELASTIASLSGRPNLEVKVRDQTLLNVVPERYVPDISRAREELNLSITVKTHEALRRTIEWNEAAIRQLAR